MKIVSLIVVDGEFDILLAEFDVDVDVKREIGDGASSLVLGESSDILDP